MAQEAYPSELSASDLLARIHTPNAPGPGPEQRPGATNGAENATDGPTDRGQGS